MSTAGAGDAQFRPQLIDLTPQILEVTLVVHHHVGRGEALLPGGLGGHSAFSLVSGHTPALKAPNAGGVAGIYDDDHVVGGHEGQLHEQRYVVYEDLPRGRGGHELGGACGDPRMGDGVQLLARLLISEGQRRQCRSIQRAILSQHPCSEGGHQCLESFAARRHHLPRDRVGIDHEGPSGRQHCGHGALA